MPFVAKQCSRCFKYALISFFTLSTLILIFLSVNVVQIALGLYQTEMRSMLFGNSAGQQYTNESGAIDRNIIYLIDEDTRCIRPQCATSSVSPFTDTTNIIKAIAAADPARPLRLVISTNGGSLVHCQQIIRWLRMHPTGYVVYCNEAYSAGTLISISGDELVMSNYSLLGKIDPVIGGHEEIIYRAFHCPGTPMCTAPRELNQFDYAVKRSVATLNTAEKIIRESVPQYARLEHAIKSQLLYSELRHYTSFSIEEVRAMGFHVRSPLPHEMNYFGYFQAK